MLLGLNPAPSAHVTHHPSCCLHCLSPPRGSAKGLAQVSSLPAYPRGVGHSADTQGEHAAEVNRMEPKAKVRWPWGCGMILGWMGWGPAMSGGDSLSPKEGAMVWSHEWSECVRERMGARGTWQVGGCSQGASVPC